MNYWVNVGQLWVFFRGSLREHSHGLQILLTWMTWKLQHVTHGTFQPLYNLYCYNLESCFFSRTFYAPPWSSLHFEYYIEKTPLNHKEKKILTDSTRHFKTKLHKIFSCNIHLHKIFSLGSFWKSSSKNITCSPHPTLIHLNIPDNWKLNL